MVRAVPLAGSVFAYARVALGVAGVVWLAVGLAVLVAQRGAAE